MDKSVKKMYRVKKLRENVYGISSSLVKCFLILGKEKAMLVDTAYGFEDITQVIREITNLPLIVINTHGHIDHTGCNFYFDNPVYIHKADVELYKKHNSAEFHRTLEKTLRIIQRLFFWVNILSDDPTRNDEKRINFQNFSFVEEGDSFNLGGMTAEIIEIAGHTKGSIAVFIPELKIVFVSDGANSGTWLFLPESTDLGTYISSLYKIKELDFEYILTGHSDKFATRQDLYDWIHVAENPDIEHGKVEKQDEIAPGAQVIRCYAIDDPKRKKAAIVIDKNCLQQDAVESQERRYKYEARKVGKRTFVVKNIDTIFKEKRFPVLQGKPENKKWYRINLDNCVAANDDNTYVDYYQGSENNLIIFFNGGGVSWNEYTAARPSSLYQKALNDTYYMIQTDLFTDFRIERGIFENSERNPFKNWSKLVVTYNTGDFHCGTGDFPYTAQDNTRRYCRHHGYLNYRKAMETVIKLHPSPDAVLVSGCSGGGFGAALLTDDIMKIYNKCDNFTCLVDSGFYPWNGWHDIARDVWKAPAEIVERIHTDNITLDVLQALKRDYGDRIKILLSSSTRDAALARMFNLYETNEFNFSKESGEHYSAWLKEMLKKVEETMQGTGVYLFDIPDKSQKKNNLTIHCIIGEKNVYDNEVEGTSCMKWIRDAVMENKISCIGKGLLD